jgi:hypothetical protein
VHPGHKLTAPPPKKEEEKKRKRRGGGKEEEEEISYWRMSNRYAKLY